MTQWEYLCVSSVLGLMPPETYISLFKYILQVQHPDDQRTFATPDEALCVLGEEGWECIHFHQDDGPRQQMIPMSLIQPLPFPSKYTLRFKRPKSGG